MVAEKARQGEFRQTFRRVASVQQRNGLCGGVTVGAASMPTSLDEEGEDRFLA
jgi:hypothetical protein